MTFNPEWHQRRSIRLKGYDYAAAGWYFVTLCTWQRECLFGEVVDGGMRLNEVGGLVETVWCRLPEHFASINLIDHVVMPNHFHGIVQITGSVGAKQGSPASPDVDGNHAKGKADEAFALPLHGTASGSLCAVIQNFKSISTRRINKLRNNPAGPVWQRNYFERVIRDDNELAAIREYIVTNPLQWDADNNHPNNLSGRALVRPISLKCTYILGPPVTPKGRSKPRPYLTSFATRSKVMKIYADILNT
ncbi:MAG: transposase [Desulfuromonadales bacterium]|nr:transposase [Desulfuromonadales bacterium]